jgi:hypothetical protein
MQQKRNRLVTAAEYARLRNLSRSTISRQIKSGVIPTREGGRIDPTEADQARERNLDRVKVAAADVRKRNPPPAETDSRPPVTEATPVSEPDAAEDDADVAGAPPDYWQIRTRLEEAKLAKAVRENLEAEGKLLSAEEVSAHWAADGTMIRDEVMALPSRIVARLPEEWRRQVSIIVQEETRRALSAISHRLSQPAVTTTRAR